MTHAWRMFVLPAECEPPLLLPLSVGCGGGSNNFAVRDPLGRESGSTRSFRCSIAHIRVGSLQYELLLVSTPLGICGALSSTGRSSLEIAPKPGTNLLRDMYILYSISKCLDQQQKKKDQDHL